MGKLICFEMLKILKSRFFFVFCSLFLLSSCFFCLPSVEQFGRARTVTTGMKEKYDFYYSLSDQELSDFCKAAEEKYGPQVFTGLNFPGDTMMLPGYFGGDICDYDVLLVHQELRLRQAEIDETRKEIVRKAEKYLKTEDTSGNRYRKRYFQNMIRCYSSDYPDLSYRVYGWSILFGRIETIFPVLFFCVLVGGLSFSQENDNGTYRFLRTVYYGGRATAAAKILAAVLLSWLFVLLNSLCSVIMIGIGYGFTGGSNPVYVLEGFELSPLRIRIRTLYAVNICIHLFIATVFSILTITISFFSRHTWIACLLGGLMAGMMITGYYIGESVLKHRDLLNCADLAYFYGSFHMANLFGIPVSVGLISCLGWLMTSLVPVLICVGFYGAGKKRSVFRKEK